MIKIMIVDDEPYIRQGLRILINWASYGCEIVAEASNGSEAVEILRNKETDLVITDIKMPKMDGISMIGYIKENISDKIHFIILSGFYEYEYAKKAIMYGVEDYVLKPVEKDELIRTLEAYKLKYEKSVEKEKEQQITEKIVFDNYIGHILAGIQNAEELKYVKRYMRDCRNIRYIGIEYDESDAEYVNRTDEEKQRLQAILYDMVKEYMGSDRYHVIPETDRTLSAYMIGFIYTESFAADEGISGRTYIERLHEYLSSRLENRIILLVGQEVEELHMLAESYKTAVIARNFQRFANDKAITVYDDIKQSEGNDRRLLCKDPMDLLIRAIEENNEEVMQQQTEAVYEYFKTCITEPEIIRINLDYMLVKIISLVNELAPDFEHDEIYDMINNEKGGVINGSLTSLREVAKKLSLYISQLRRNSFGGVLKEMEREIIENYTENLSLKTLSEKYYMNSAYLGQIFRKKYGIPFKDYLNNYRIERAAELLLRTDKKVYLVADAVGFNNTDYFVSKFVQLKGITPLQYRKQFNNHN